MPNRKKPPRSGQPLAERLKPRPVSTASPKDYGRKPLAKFEGIDPEQLVARTPSGPNSDPTLGDFVLTMAMVFNDLKGTIDAVVYAEKFAPGTDIRPEIGERAGRVIQAIRWQAGLLNELMQTMVANRTLIESEPFRALIKRFPTTERESWLDLERVAFDEHIEDKSTRRYLLGRLRQQVAFHYAAHTVAKAYRKHFFDDPTSEVNVKALFSDGQNLEETRFYFADAAGSAALVVETGLSFKDVTERIADIARSTNFALRQLVMTYLRDRKHAIVQWAPKPT